MACPHHSASTHEAHDAIAIDLNVTLCGLTRKMRDGL
jgi:hypothetical protein